MMNRTSFWLAALMSLGLGMAASAALRPNGHIMLIGDSITNGGTRPPWGSYHQLTNVVGQCRGDYGIRAWPFGYNGATVGDLDGMISRSVRIGWKGGARYGKWMVEWVDAATNGVDVVFINLGMNDLIRPTVSEDPASLDQWIVRYRSLLATVRKNFKPRQFVLGTVTPYMEDWTSPRDKVRREMNARIRKMAAAEPDCVVADCGGAIEKLIDEARLNKTVHKVVGDFVHPNHKPGHTAMLLEFFKAIGGEPEIEAKLAAQLRETMTKGPGAYGPPDEPSVAWRLRNVPCGADEREMAWTLDYKAHDALAKRGEKRACKVDFKLPEGWTMKTLESGNGCGRVELRGVPDRMVNPVKITADFGDGEIAAEVGVPAPWRVTEEGGRTALVRGTLETLGGTDPRAIEPHQVFFGGTNWAWKAERTLVSAKEREVEYTVGSDSFSTKATVTLLLNGTEVETGTVGRPNRPKDFFRGKFTLQPGENRLELRVRGTGSQAQITCSLWGGRSDRMKDLRVGWGAK